MIRHFIWIYLITGSAIMAYSLWTPALNGARREALNKLDKALPLPYMYLAAYAAIVTWPYWIARGLR